MVGRNLPGAIQQNTTKRAPVWSAVNFPDARIQQAAVDVTESWRGYSFLLAPVGLGCGTDFISMLPDRVPTARP